MNGIIHLITCYRSEYWIDGEPVASVLVEGFDNPAKYGRGATITYKNGEERVFEDVVHVEIIPSDCKDKSVPGEDKKENTDISYLHHIHWGDIGRYMDDIDLKEREEKRKTAKCSRRIRRSGYRRILISFCYRYKIDTVGALLKTKPEVLKLHLGPRVFDLTQEALKELYNIDYMKFHHE